MRYYFLVGCLTAALTANKPTALFAQAAAPLPTTGSRPAELPAAKHRALAPRASGVRALEPRTTGTVLLLTTDRVLEGDIVRVADQYRIRRGTAETIVGAERVKRLCADWAETLAYVRSQANLGDPDERLRLARWCHLHNLRDEALAEARIAAEMRPTHPETRQLLQILQRAASATPTAAAAATATQPPTHGQAASQPASKPSAGAIRPVSASEPLPQVDLSADGLALFNTRVQPILMNLCASCHAGSDAGAFCLHRAFENGARAAAQRNLAAVMAHLDLERPALSPLLIKAVSVHGPMSQPPIRDRRAIPYATLHQWVERVAANNPHLRSPHLRQQPAAAAAPTFRQPNADPATLAVAPPATTPNRLPNVVSRPLPRVETPAAPSATQFTPTGTIFVPPPRGAGPAPQGAPPVTPGVPPTPGAAPDDPFDPALFNRRR